MIFFEKVALIFVLVLSIAVTITGFFWQGWSVFIGLTMVVSTIVPMLGAWNRSPRIAYAAMGIEKKNVLPIPT